MKTFHDFGIEVSGNSGQVRTTCPQCSKDRKKKNVKCLAVNLDKGVFTCFHCGWSGGLNERETKPKYLHWQKPAYRKPEKKPETNLPEKVLAFFQSRCISKKTLIRNKIGMSKVYMPQVEGDVNAIAFPYFRDGELINVKYRDGNKNFRMEAGAERVLYGLDDIGEVLVIVEGEIDKLSIEEIGIESCVSVPDGAPSENTKDYSSKFNFLESAKEKLSKVKEFIIAVDSDKPGQRLEDELIRRLGRDKCLKVTWPEGCKDANEVLVKFGVNGLGDAIVNAELYPVEGSFSTKDLAGKIYNLHQHGWDKGQDTGWASLDKYYTVRAGDFTVVTGIPNSGKSNWIDALLINLAKNHGWSFGIFSPENQPLEDHMARMIEKFTGKPFHEGKNERVSSGELKQSMLWLDNHFSWILPNNDEDWTIEKILDIAKHLVFQKGIRGLVIDPWNELDHLRPNNLSETEYISRTLKRIRQFARVCGVHVWIVAHPAKLYKNKEGEYPVPTPYDISGSAHWRNKSDNCITVYRNYSDKNNRVVEIYIQKIRFKQVGKIGMCELAYNHVTGTYHELSKANEEIPDSYFGDNED